MNKSLFARWRANFVTGLAVVLPGAVSIVLVVWILRNIASITDTLLIFLPKSWTHEEGGKGALFWYSSWLAFFMAVVLITIIGQFTRVYIGQKIIRFTDTVLLRVPLINKIYGTIKQVNEAFTSGSKSSFKQVVLVEFPRPGSWTVAFLTNDQPEVPAALPGKMISVFVPTTPNPTSGFMLLVPETSVIKLEMSVSDGIKFIISLGSLSLEQQQAQMGKLK
jgi:uncharacterized membrane protein